MGTKGASLVSEGTGKPQLRISYEMSGWIVGEKAIAEYLSQSWETIEHWRTHFHFPVRQAPTGEPIILPYEADCWLILFDGLMRGDLKETEN